MPRVLRLPSGHVLGPSYRMVRELGGGGMSRVFVARELSLERDVVVKLLPPDLVAGIKVDRFRREIHVTARLQHPHIVPILATASAEGLIYCHAPTDTAIANDPAKISDYPVSFAEAVT